MIRPVVNIHAIHDEIAKGLQNESGRLHCAWKNRLFYEGDFSAFPTREENQYHERWDMRRTSRIARRIIHVLTSALYKKPPVRTLAAGTEATAWLDRCYRASAMQALWPESDRAALVNDWCAFRFAGNDDPATIVDIELFTSDQLVVWTVPGKPRKVGAVATIEKEDASRTLTLWTADEIRTYYTTKWAPGQTAGGTAWKFRSAEPNPYGTLPFSFVHADYPTTEFHTPGIGDFLTQLNDYVNYDLDNLGDAKRYLAFPIPVAEGVSPTWTPPGKMKPGTWVMLPGYQGTAGDDAMSTPTLRYVGPDLGFVEVTWDDLNRFVDRALEDLGVPPGTIRLDGAGSANSGVQVMVEQGPLLAWTEGRQVTFSDYESEAARKGAEVSAAHLRANGRPVPSWLDATAKEPGLGLKRPPLYVQLPGPERDRSDDYRVQRGYASKVDVLMEREDLSEEQAIAKLERVERINKELKAKGIDPGSTAQADQAPSDHAPGNEPSVEPITGD